MMCNSLVLSIFINAIVQQTVLQNDGNTYRLIVDVEYRLKIVFIVWFGTHKEYDKINAKKIDYVKAD